MRRIAIGFFRYRRLGRVFARPVRTGDIGLVKRRVDIPRSELRPVGEVLGQFRFAKGRLPYLQDWYWAVVWGELLDLEEEFWGETEG